MTWIFMLIRHISLKIILKIKLVYEIFVLKKSFLPKTFFFLYWLYNNDNL